MNGDETLKKQESHEFIHGGVNEEKRGLEIKLNGQALEQFLDIKRTTGLTDAEVLKLIINRYYEEIKEKLKEKEG